LAAVASQARKQGTSSSSRRGGKHSAASRCTFVQGAGTAKVGHEKPSKAARRAMELEVHKLVSELSAGADPAALFAALPGLLNLLGPAEPALAAETMTANAASVDLSPLDAAWQAIAEFFFNPRLQWDENGNMLLDPQGEPLPDNLWTQFVACQATLMQRLTEGLKSLGVPQAFGWAVVCYTLGIRAILFPFVKSQMETTAKMQVLNPRVKELKEKYKDDEDRLNQEVGMLFMDLQVDPLQAIVPLLVQLPVFWGLYRGIRRLAIVEYEPLREGFLWIPSLYGPGFTPDPSLEWISQWQGPLIELHPKVGWETFGLYALLPTVIFFAYKQVLGAATQDKEDAPKILEFFPYMLGFITVELPQAMGLYIATNIASSVALTNYTKANLAAKIPGYDEFVETGKWPPGVDPEKVLAKAFGVQRLTGDGNDMDDPKTVPEAIFLGRADAVKALVKEEGRDIDEFDEKGIQATAYSVALDNPELMERLFSLGADPCKTDKQGNTLLHYSAGYGRTKFLELLFEQGIEKVKNAVNKEGQTALDVARANLQQDKVADACREIIPLLEKRGAEGKATTKEDEALMEKVREDRKKEAELSAARGALMALAKGAQAKAEAEAAAKAETEPKEETSVFEALPMALNEEKKKKQLEKREAELKQARGMIEDKVAESLDRIKKWDKEALRERFGDKLSEEQLERLAEKVQQMSPEQLMQFAATGEQQKDEAEEDESNGKHSEEAQHKAAELKPAEEKKKEEAASPAKKKVSLVVD